MDATTRRDMNLDLREMIAGDPARLRFVKRYAIFNCLHPESVAEHSFFTALYSLFIGTWVTFHETGPVEMDKLLCRAIIHDLEEARTGDILRMFKHRDRETAAVIEEASKAEVKEVFGRIFSPDTHRSRSAGQAFLDNWMNSKDASIEGRILKFADFLSVLGYLLQELQVARRVEVAQTEDFKKYARTFHRPEFDFIRPLIDQAQDLIKEVLD